MLSWGSCQSPVAHSCCLLNHPNSFRGGCSSLVQNWMQIHCSTHSVILDVTATQYTCSLNSIYCPHWLAEWSHHCSRMHIPVHSPWMPGYTSVVQIVLLILTTAGLFPDRPHITFWAGHITRFSRTIWIITFDSMFVLLYRVFFHL